MTLHILLALLNGAFIGTSRAVNGQLSTRIGPFRASVWNHVVGFVLLTVVLFALHGLSGAGSGSGSGAEAGTAVGPGAVPVSAYLGGVFGALFVAVNSHVFPRLGAMNASLLVISGQVLSAVAIDGVQDGSLPSAPRLLGVALVLTGLALPRLVERYRKRA
ncbi:DMT family transporter [Streptomyces sp. NPDC058548]|uniref:DMT family transporter n=1 Tax=Streptomyces sp. NPDC058548 TaxID=3346545 RepID=UPI00364C5B3E